jgi:phosphoenolpyruvate-protein phosphotransferase
MAVVLDRGGQHVRRPIPSSARATEVQRARNALQSAAADLEKIAGELRDAGRRADAEIVETGVLIALDPELGARVVALIEDAGLAAEDALREAAEQTAIELSRLDDPTLALRADDVRSVGRRAAECAAGTEARSLDGILVAATLGPADVAELAPKVQGIALAGGGVTAHAAIVARSLGLPMVVGVGPALLEVGEGEEVVLDGDNGLIVRTPDVERAELAREYSQRRREVRAVAVARRSMPAETTDGHRIRILANASTAAELSEATAQGAEGVGLLRSELLFLDASGWPSFRDQVASLRPVLSQLSGRIATVRLFDFGGDKTPPFLRGVEQRGIDLLLSAPDQLRVQLAAIVEAGAGTNLRILVPMVTSPTQLHTVGDVLRAVLDGRPQPQLGAMIETPEAARCATDIARAADFFSIGTNDLTQLVLGLDREQSKSAPVVDARVMRLIAAAVQAAHAAQILVDVCGEAASEANAMPMLVGLGVDELSVAAARIGQVRQWVRELDFRDCQKESENLLRETRDTSRERV